MPTAHTSAIQRIFEHRYVSMLCVLIAILLKAFLMLHYFQFESDRLFQALAARNLAEGFGLTYQYVHAGDLNTVIYTPLDRWPPGYSLLLTPIYLVTKNLLISAVVLDMIAVVMFISTLRSLLKLLRVPIYLVNVLLLFNGAAVAPYLFGPTDLLALSFVLLTCYMSVAFYLKTEKGTAYAVGAGFVNFVPVLLRFMYLPSTFIVPGMLIWTGLRTGNMRIFRGGLYSLITSGLLTAALFVYQKTYAGASAYIMPAEHGLYLSNLLLLYPAVFGAFVNLTFFTEQMHQLLHVDFGSIAHIVEIVHLPVFVLMLFAAVFMIFKKQVVPRSGCQMFAFSAVLINICIILLLAFLSVTNSSVHPFPYRSPWTFIGDGRYFVFLMLVLPLFAVQYLFSPDRRFKRLRIGQNLLLILLFCAIVHSSYFVLRRSEPLGYKGGNVLLVPAATDFLRSKIQIAKRQGYDIVFTGSDETVSNWAFANGAKGLLYSEELMNNELKATENTIVYIILDNSGTLHFSKFLQRPGIQIEQQLTGLTIYSYIVKGNG